MGHIETTARINSGNSRELPQEEAHNTMTIKVKRRKPGERKPEFQTVVQLSLLFPLLVILLLIHFVGYCME